MEAASRRILIVANRTAATPLLMDAVRKRATEGVRMPVATVRVGLIYQSRAVALDARVVPRDA